ncbi:MAG: PHB depolymerase family esterase [Betaproteobacteria bacterium]
MKWRKLWTRVKDAFRRRFRRKGTGPATASGAEASQRQGKDAVPGAPAAQSANPISAPTVFTLDGVLAAPSLPPPKSGAAPASRAPAGQSPPGSEAVPARAAPVVKVPRAAPVRPGVWVRDAVMAANGQIDLALWVLPQRAFRIYEPAKLAAQPCVLVMLHGCQQTPEDIAEGTRLNEHADERGWLVVYPDQTEAANKNRCWNWFDPANLRGDGECALIVAMLAAVRTRYALPHAPAFLAGMSAGGALASLLALRYSSLWAGVAIHSGLPYAAATDPWGALRVMREGPLGLDAARALILAKRRAREAIVPVPAMIFHGAVDNIVDRRNADLLVRQFLGWNGYLARSAAWDDAPLPPADSTPVTVDAGHDYILRDYRNDDLAPVRECEVVGMSHAWSGGDSALPFNDDLGPDGSALMMEFFAGVVGTATGNAAGIH